MGAASWQTAPAAALPRRPALWAWAGTVAASASPGKAAAWVVSYRSPSAVVHTVPAGSWGWAPACRVKVTSPTA